MTPGLLTLTVRNLSEEAAMVESSEFLTLRPRPKDWREIVAARPS